ncbi:MAG: methyltransferase domain-containing protein [Acetobacteraceae bacterium]
MTVHQTIARALALDSDGSKVLRARRFRLCLRLIDDVLRERGTCRIIDLGGEPGYWRAVGDVLGSRSCHVTLVNQSAFPLDDNRFALCIGDARNLPCYDDMSFDIVHSNSVIEHVGRWHDMVEMAREVRRLAPRYFVQTPYFWFPMEPHCSTLFFHWYPEPIRRRMLMKRPRGTWGKAPDIDTAMRQIQSNALLDISMVRTLFPDAEIHKENFCGLTKSLIAIKSGHDASGNGARPHG